MDDFEENARRLFSDRVLSSVLIIERVISRYERERRVRVVTYEDYLAATKRGVIGGMIAPIDRHWWEVWSLVRAEVEVDQ